MDERKSDKTFGVIGTLLFHVVLLLVLVLVSLTSIPTEEEGILVALGDSPTGMGSSIPTRSAAPSQVSTPPPSQEAAPPQPAASTPAPAPQQVLTQKSEDAPAISAQEKARKDAEVKRQTEERNRQAEVERQKKAEAERQRQAELERQRIEAEERRKQEEQARQAAEARKAVDGAFSNSGANSQSAGDTPGSGTQGKLTGDPNATSRTGSGKGGEGVSFSLDGRRSIGDLPKPENNSQEYGKVVVKITVDRNGVVTKAEPIQRGTTTPDLYLQNEAKKAALKARFNADPKAAAIQEGTITYIFELK